MVLPLVCRAIKQPPRYATGERECTGLVWISEKETFI